MYANFFSTPMFPFKVKKIMNILEQSLIIFCIAGINAALWLYQLLLTIWYFQSDTSNLIPAHWHLYSYVVSLDQIVLYNSLNEIIIIFYIKCDSCNMILVFWYFFFWSESSSGPTRCESLWKRQKKFGTAEACQHYLETYEIVRDVVECCLI